MDRAFTFWGFEAAVGCTMRTPSVAEKMSHHLYWFNRNTRLGLS